MLHSQLELKLEREERAHKIIKAKVYKRQNKTNTITTDKAYKPINYLTDIYSTYSTSTYTDTATTTVTTTTTTTQIQMKISTTIATIALGLQGFLLHTDAASHSPLGLRGGGDSTPADSDTAYEYDPGYYGYDYARHLPSRDGEDESEFAVNFDEDEVATDFVLESIVTAGTGVYLQGLPGATRHGARCRLFLLAVVDINAWREAEDSTISVLIITAVFLQES
jgi:hypothetical protein